MASILVARDIALAIAKLREQRPQVREYPAGPDFVVFVGHRIIFHLSWFVVLGENRWNKTHHDGEIIRDGFSGVPGQMILRDQATFHRIQVSFPPEIHTEMVTEAKAQGQSISELLRGAWECYMSFLGGRECRYGVYWPGKRYRRFCSSAATEARKNWLERHPEKEED